MCQQEFLFTSTVVASQLNLEEGTETTYLLWEKIILLHLFPLSHNSTWEGDTCEGCSALWKENRDTVSQKCWWSSMKASLPSLLQQEATDPSPEENRPLPRFVPNTRERYLNFGAEAGRKMIAPDTEKSTSQILLSSGPIQPPYLTGRMTSFSLLVCPPDRIIRASLQVC